MYPAYQRFRAGDAAGPQVDLGLVMQDKLVLFAGAAQHAFQFELGDHRGIQFGRIERQPLAAVLGLLERSLGVPEHRFGISAVAWITGDAAVDGQVNVVAVQLYRLPD
jgi:hypothetical protein